MRTQMPQYAGLGERLKELRYKAHLTQEELAGQLEDVRIFCDKSAISRWENDRRLPKRDELVWLLKFFSQRRCLSSAEEVRSLMTRAGYPVYDADLEFILGEAPCAPNTDDRTDLPVHGKAYEAIRKPPADSGDSVRVLGAVDPARCVSRLQAWAKQLSDTELSLISKEKWNPESPELYVPRRQIEDQLTAFLQRSERRSRGFCVMGETGLGKTNLLCRLYRSLVDTSLSGRRRIALFLTARGLQEQVGDGVVSAFFEDALIEACCDGAHSESAEREAALQRATRMLGEVVSGQPIELIVIVDALNELPAGEIQEFADQLARWLRKLSTVESRAPQPLYVSLIVSCRAWSWRSLWNGREMEQRQYFTNLQLDDDGQILENLSLLDQSWEAPEAYKRAMLPTPWAELDDEVRTLCRNPFFLHILRALCVREGRGIDSGTYFEILTRYDDSILLKNRSDGISLGQSARRTAVLNAMVMLTSGGQEELENRFARETAKLREVATALPEYPLDDITCTVRELCDESVLEARGDEIRFSFDPFFDFRFREILLQRYERDSWDARAWLSIVSLYAQSGYHHNGVVAALAQRFERDEALSEKTEFLEALLLRPGDVIPSHRRLIVEAVVLFGEKSPSELAQMLLSLNEHEKNQLYIAEIACRILVSPRVTRANRQHLFRVFARVLVRCVTGPRKARERIQRRALVNMAGGLGKAQDGPELIMDLADHILETGSDQYSPRARLQRKLDVFLCPPFQKAFLSIRRRMFPYFRGTSVRTNLAVRIYLAILTTPATLLTLLRMPPREVGGIWETVEVTRRLEIAIEVVVKGLLLWLGEQNWRDERFQEQIGAMERFLFDEIVAPLVEAYDRLGSDITQRRVLSEGVAFVVVAFLWPIVNRLFAYSERGLDYLAIVLQDDGSRAELAELLALLDPDISICEVPNALARLRALYLEPDAFRNYLGMGATIAQCIRNFAAFESFLLSLFSHPTQRVIYTEQASAPETVKLAREVMVACTYTIRRIARTNRGELEAPANFVEGITQSFFSFDETDHHLPAPLRLFLSTELFGHEDPFNPLLPLAVTAQELARTQVSLGTTDDYVLALIDQFYGSQFSESERIELVKRVLMELVPAAYFAPLPVIGTLRNLLLERTWLFLREPAIRSALIEVIRDLQLVVGVRVADLFESLGTYAIQLSSESKPEAADFGRFLAGIRDEVFGTVASPAAVEYLYRSIDVFGGLDALTAALMENRGLRRLVIPSLQQHLMQAKTAPELFQMLGADVLDALASEEISFSVKKLLFSEVQTRGL